MRVSGETDGEGNGRHVVKVELRVKVMKDVWIYRWRGREGKEAEREQDGEGREGN